MSSPSRVRAGIPTGGQFAASAHHESDISLGSDAAGLSAAELYALSLQSQSEPDIDAKLAVLYGQEMRARARRGRVLDDIHIAAGDRQKFGYGMGWRMSNDEALQQAQEVAQQSDPRTAQAQRALDALAVADAEIERVTAEQLPLDSEFDRRGGWNRAFVVTNADGHVHSSMGCSTCNRGVQATSFAWLTDYSGAEEEKIVSDAGWRACTQCYPSAPVGDHLTSRIKAPGDDEREKASQDRADKKAQAAADRIAKGLTPDGSPFIVRWVEHGAVSWHRGPDGKQVYGEHDRDSHEAFKTERSAVMWYVDQHFYRPPTADQRVGLDQVVEAVAAKHGKSTEDVRAELAVKIEAKRKREGL